MVIFSRDTLPLGCCCSCCYLHELHAGLERVVKPEEEEEVLLHRQQLGKLHHHTKIKNTLTILGEKSTYTHTRGYNVGGELLAKFWRISLYMAEDAIAKLYEYVT